MQIFFLRVRASASGNRAIGRTTCWMRRQRAAGYRVCGAPGLGRGVWGAGCAEGEARAAARGRRGRASREAEGRAPKADEGRRVAARVRPLVESPILEGATK